MRVSCFGVLLLIALFQTAGAQSLPTDHFAAIHSFAQLSLSPSGRHLAGKIDIDGRYGLVVFDLDSMLGQQLVGSEPFLMSTGDFTVRRVQWASAARLLVSVEYAARRQGVATVETRLLAISPDGGNPQRISTSNRGEPPAQIGDTVVDVMTDDPDHILMSFNAADASQQRLWRVNVHSGARKLVGRAYRGLWEWTVDQQYRPRLGAGAVNTSWRVMHRAPESRAWELLMEFPVDSGRVFRPMLFDPEDPDLLYVLSNHEGDLAGLYSYRLSAGVFEQIVYRADGRDAAGIVRTPDGRRIAGVVLAGDDDNVVWFDAGMAGLVGRIQRRLPDQRVGIVSSSDDLSRLLVLAEATHLSPRYYLYAPESDSLVYVAPTNRQLDGLALAGMERVRYKARDGLEIEAYLSLPPGAFIPLASRLPAVIMPHGGPHSRDYSGFDPLVQLLTHRGYAVLQMNFRGSSGYGSEFESAGYRQWGLAMQDDVTDGTRWLIQQGIADSQRICIVGASYGGYAALMGLVREPELYQCAASFAGVTDLPRMLSYLRNYIGGRAASVFIGHSWRDRDSLRLNSPLRRADEIVRPVLLVHGDEDRVVPVDQSQRMARALESHGAPVRYIELDEADHYLRRADHRLAYFEALDEFLRENLGDVGMSRAVE